MFTENDINFIQGEPGEALVWVIDGQCLYDLALHQKYVDIFLGADQVIDISGQYPEHDGIVVRFMKDGQIMDEFKTSDYFGSILLSNPTILNLNDYPYGRYVQSPYATFDGEKFIITNRDVSSLPPWYV